MALPVDICNLALLALGQPPVSSIDPPFTDQGGLAATLAFQFPLVRDAELRAHPWGFARKRVTVAVDATAPAFGYEQRFKVPSDYLRFVDERQTDWEIEGEYILTDDATPLELIYIKRVTNSELFDPLFNIALSCKLALGLTEKLTQSNTKKTIIEKDYDRAIADARRTNAILRPQQTPPEDSFVTVRR